MINPFNISVTGLDEQPGTELGYFIGGIARQLAVTLDLRCLEGITVSNHYAQALANFERGFAASDALKPTNESFVQGSAMVVHCKRGEEFKCHVFIDLNLAASALFAEDAETRQMATAAIVHEMGHVHDFGTLCRMMPDLMLTPLPHNLEGWLYKAVNSAWSEYFACFVAADFDHKALDAYVETFVTALNEFPETMRLAIIAYRTSADLDALMATVNDRAGLLFKFAGYALGHLEGIEKELADTHPAAWEHLKQAGFEKTWQGIRDALHGMHDAYPNWSGLDSYKPLGEVMIAYLKVRNIELSPQAEGFHVNIPFTRETMPAGGMEMLALSQIAGALDRLRGG
jgi:hypothetical protein